MDASSKNASSVKRSPGDPPSSAASGSSAPSGSVRGGLRRQIARRPRSGLTTTPCSELAAHSTDRKEVRPTRQHRRSRPRSTPRTRRRQGWTSRTHYPRRPGRSPPRARSDRHKEHTSSFGHWASERISALLIGRRERELRAPPLGRDNFVCREVTAGQARAPRASVWRVPGSVGTTHTHAPAQPGCTGARPVTQADHRARIADRL